MYIIAELESINKYNYCIFKYPSYFQSKSSSLYLIRSAQRREIRCCSPWILAFSPVKIGHLFLLRRDRIRVRWVSSTSRLPEVEFPTTALSLHILFLALCFASAQSTCYPLVPLGYPSISLAYCHLIYSQVDNTPFSELDPL